MSIEAAARQARERAAFEANFPGCAVGRPNAESEECRAGWEAWEARAALAQAAPAEPVATAWVASHESGRVLHLGGPEWKVEAVSFEPARPPWSKPMGLEVLSATPPAPSAPLDDPRLQGLFSDAISGALAFGAQNTNPPPAGHWLERFWQMGRAERALSEAAPPAAEPPSTPEMAALWQKIGSPLTGDEFQRHVTAILLRFAPPPAAEPVALTDEVLRYAMAAMGTGSPRDAEKFRLFWRYAHEAAPPAVPQATALTDEQIVAIRDEHLPSQGERFDCIAFARALLAAVPQTEPTP
jgi:hypothetical protein